MHFEESLFNLTDMVHHGNSALDEGSVREIDLKAHAPTSKLIRKH